METQNIKYIVVPEQMRDIKIKKTPFRRSTLRKDWAHNSTSPAMRTMYVAFPRMKFERN